MARLFALLAILLICTGALLLAVPKAAPILQDVAGASRSAAPVPSQQVEASLPSLVSRARDIAEQINAPLSILFGFLSLLYSRRTYHASKARAGAHGA